VCKDGPVFTRSQVKQLLMEYGSGWRYSLRIEKLIPASTPGGDIATGMRGKTPLLDATQTERKKQLRFLQQGAL
jgi:hypothetical protein